MKECDEKGGFVYPFVVNTIADLSNGGSIIYSLPQTELLHALQSRRAG